MSQTAPAAVPAAAEALRWTSAGATAARVRAGELTPRQVVAAALARIDAAEPQLNAFAYLWPEQALAEADAVAARLAAGEFLPLAGVPVALKDEVPVEGVVVTKGSFANTQPSAETAEVVRLVRAAGGIPVGSTRTPEFCLVPFTESARGGVTRNPWDLSRTPGGSSGGSAAAVAAGLVPLGLGGDGGGSLRGPGAWCGLPGFMPTPGSVSSAPFDSVWTGMAVLGGLARSIADTALLYDVLLAEPHGLAAAVAEAPPAALRIAQSLDRAADRPIPQGGPIEAPWVRATDLTATLLSDAGHEVRPAELRFANAPLKFSVRYLTSTQQEVSETDEPARIEGVAKLAARLGRPAGAALGWAMNLDAERRAVERSLDGFDLLLTPTMPCAPPPVGEYDRASALTTTLRAARRVSFMNVWNLLGWPGISVPAGLDAQGLPLGVLLTGRPGSERLLLQVAAQLEALRPWELGKAVA